jgi:phosphate transport system substrate-binding protein
MPKNGMLIRISLAAAAAAILATVAVSAAGAARQSVTLKGAGSTFVQPLINAWTQLPTPSSSPFTSAKHISVTYGGGGSGAGVADIIAKTVDFGASDAPLSAFSTTCTTCIQTPWALSGTAIIVHINGVTKTLNMSGAVLAKIYLGQIKFWDDKAIKGINKGVSIPHTAITTVHRDSSSGTTYNFTDFLSHVSAYWKAHYGATTLIGTWPGSNAVQAHGSSGIAAAVAATNGAIGYVDLWYGITSHLKYLSIQNQHGRYVQPTLASIAQASKLDQTPKANGELSIVDPPNKTAYFGAYPISTYTYVDVQKHSSAMANPLKTFLLWAVTSGQSHAAANYFVPLPTKVVTWDKTNIKKIVS